MSELVVTKYPEDLTGLRFGKLRVMYKCALPKKNSYHCVCECGNERDFSRAELVGHHNKSCGKCSYKRERHGEVKTRLYSIFKSMKQRCYNPNNDAYNNYGGRGVKICDSWLESYINFRDDMYESYLKHVEEYGEDNTTIDRIDVNGDYCKENCRWATWGEQSLNKRTNRYIEFNGKIKPLSEHIKDTKSEINRSTIMYRLEIGLSPEDALTLSKDAMYSKHFYNGVPLTTYCKNNNIDYDLVIGRLVRGWDIDSAVSAPSGVYLKNWLNRNNEPLKIKSTPYYKDVPLKQYCEENSLPYDRTYRRILRGWDADSAVNAPSGMNYKTWLKIKENSKNSFDNAN